jgi:hypothetical protein
VEYLCFEMSLSMPPGPDADRWVRDRANKDFFVLETMVLRNADRVLRCDRSPEEDKRAPVSELRRRPLGLGFRV